MRKQSVAITAFVLMLLAIGFGLSRCSRGPSTMPPLVPSPITPPPTVAPAPVAPAPLPPVVKPVPKIEIAKPPVKPVTPTAPATQPNGAPIPPKLDLHAELIPKDISIVRCYYNMQGIAPPGSRFGFDINGSGFTAEFQKMITVESGVDEVHIENLKLVTTNQIHGDIVVGDKAPTAFAYPRVLIKGLPVFRAPEPFAVVRPGEVLTIFFISMEENGRGGRFRVITNITDDQFKQFQVLPSTANLAISPLEPHLPYVVESGLHIGPGLPPGGYGMSVSIAGKTVYHHDDMIHIVRPNVGQTGFVLGLVPVDRFHRPGDRIELYLQGTGFAPTNASVLQAVVNEFDMGPGSFTYLSPAQMRLTFQAPANAPARGFGVKITGSQKESLFQKDDVFQLVPANWVEGIQVSPPVKPGDHGTLKISGRDFSPEFVKKFQIDLDEPGITVKDLHAVDATTLSADIAISSSVAAGDYWLHLSDDGQKIDPPYGSIIKVQPN